jgi:hypothetical protein
MDCCNSSVTSIKVAATLQRTSLITISLKANWGKYENYRITHIAANITLSYNAVQDSRLLE